MSVDVSLRDKRFKGSWKSRRRRTHPGQAYGSAKKRNYFTDEQLANLRRQAFVPRVGKEEETLL